MKTRELQAAILMNSKKIYCIFYEGHIKVVNKGALNYFL